jgi:hypothetical protein
VSETTLGCLRCAVLSRCVQNNPLKLLHKCATDALLRAIMHEIRHRQTTAHGLWYLFNGHQCSNWRDVLKKSVLSVPWLAAEESILMAWQVLQTFVTEPSPADVDTSALPTPAAQDSLGGPGPPVSSLSSHDTDLVLENAEVATGEASSEARIRQCQGTAEVLAEVQVLWDMLTTHDCAFALYRLGFLYKHDRRAGAVLRT